MKLYRLKLFSFKVVNRNNCRSERILAVNEQVARLAITNINENAKLQEISNSIFEDIQYKLVALQTFNASERLRFFRNMHKCLVAGASLKDALALCVHSSTHPVLKGILAHIIYEITKHGISLSDGFRMYPDHFDSYTIALITASESSGRMYWAFHELAKECENRNTIQTKIKANLFYPIILLLLCVIAVFIISVFALPNIIDNFKQFGSSIPPLTASFIKAVDIFKKFRCSILVFSLIVLIISWTYRKYLRKSLLPKLLCGFPWVNNIIMGLGLANGLKVISTLMEVGLHIDIIYDFAGGVSNIPQLKDYFSAIHSKIKAGHDPEDAYFTESYRLKKLGRIVSAELQIAKFCGDRDKILSQVADSIYSESIIKADALTKFIEPLMLIPISAFIGLLMIIVYLPIFDLMMNILKN